MPNMLPRDRAELILALGKAGWSVSAIAGQLGYSPTTIRSYLTGRKTPGVRTARPRLLTGALADYSRQRLTEDPQLRPNALFNELKELGFQASKATFYREIQQLRQPSGQPTHPNQDLLDLVSRSRLLTDALADYGRLRLTEDPQLRPNALFNELKERGLNASKATFYRELQQFRQPVEQPALPRPLGRPGEHTVVLPRPIAPITGESLSSYLPRLARANHLTLAEVLAALPSWFSTKINNSDELSQHHMLVPATTDALNALARLARTTPQHLAGALPAFGATHTRGPVRATTACRYCTARRGVSDPIPVHLPVHLKVCTHHGIWLSDARHPNLDVTVCPEIITAQHRANRLLRRYTPQQLVLAHEIAVTAIPSWPTSQAAIPRHWRHRLLTLQTVNQHRGIGTDHEAYTRAAKYPDAIALVPGILNIRANEQDPMANSPDPRAPRQP
ncbi:TniQ family protein [Rhodococcus sp. ACPA1]|uniref:TniQ family protein n=1 Tax=Rhodococcus sp. ACPA1 TaxID=2028572 RepID=UPI000BB10782|nr:TniQ family protein [Rhodococcus sp. ACPA1]PBC45293.1 hypothetical protein CJ177_46405 [Rhodococcus sp. ACPA1]